MAKKKPIPAENSNNFFKAGWKPDIEIDQTTGKGSIVHVGTDPNYQNRLDDVIREWGFDPKEYEIDGILKGLSEDLNDKGFKKEPKETILKHIDRYINKN